MPLSTLECCHPAPHPPTAPTTAPQHATKSSSLIDRLLKLQNRVLRSCDESKKQVVHPTTPTHHSVRPTNEKPSHIGRQHTRSRSLLT